MPLKLVSVEAMDDSVMFAPSIASLRKIVALSERFQRPYGVQTAWDSPDKTVIFTLGAKVATSASDQFHVNGTSIKVPVAEKPSLLRAIFTETETSYRAILAIVHAFPIPRTRDYHDHYPEGSSGHATPKDPTTVGHAATNTISSCRLDKAITRRVCTAIDVLHSATPV
ncbi:hypothetical protein I316_02170 [Kwoniella heveanensis BCC8398]|uniref:Uncharacterized protein n=1 Tax=Kwoniella heveanensis BCC8398 TaxID=1296120 RepID=A0A1B9GZ49_9TREE|nr:hypothetical protein I316_02170 [Kwoniella heveanensis BCC8398]